ncbi:zinc-binding oxidoreductase [Aspergillus sclerotioniger CBS 115572]|uniref:Zinc-binding oxidoreductase n=1 Tax=Aspergillus sclerotioniger CBS 115572 TaxID=1450535 RepID=A0A317V6G2_9EURO|nr:zinc-binding oxidoreductase [Aspergillus sclerotioniger CBS 115572]PWY69656.1 zinc-binding oxidoreductase [Aspergillus sclerotioniger CBS 115572]
MALRTARTLIQPTAELNIEDLKLIFHIIPSPNPTKNKYLIHVHACSLSAGELLWPRNFPPPQSCTLIPCPNISSTIVSASLDSPFQPGAEIYAQTNYIRPGNARDYTIAITDELALKLRDLSWVEAAAVPVSTETAWQILFIHTGIMLPGAEIDRILVTAASGGVAARILKIKIVGTCEPDNVELVRSMGAEKIMDYQGTDLKIWVKYKAVRKIDMMVNYTVKKGETVLSIVQPPDGVRPWSEKGGVRDVFFVMQSSGKQLGMITKLMEKGKCRGMVDSVWPLEKFRPVFERLDTGHTCGKIMLDLALNQ